MQSNGIRAVAQEMCIVNIPIITKTPANASVLYHFSYISKTSLSRLFGKNRERTIPTRAGNNQVSDRPANGRDEMIFETAVPLNYHAKTSTNDNAVTSPTVNSIH